MRADLDRWEADGDVAFVGDDGPRLFPVTREEALYRLRDFLDTRLGAFGPHEDAMLDGDRWMAHSLLSPALNLGLLDPVEVVHTAERRHPMTWRTSPSTLWSGSGSPSATESR